MVKILHTIPDLHIGGVGKLLLKLLESFDDNRFQHHLCYFGKNETLLEDFRELNIIIHKIPYSGLSALPSTIIRFNSIVKKNKIDIIHNHLFLDRMITGLSYPFLSVKIVTTIHTTNEYKDADTLKNKLQIKLEDFLAKRTTKKFITVSNTVKQVAVDKKNIPLSRIQTIYSGVNIPEKRDRSGRIGLTFISVGRFVPSKGFRELLYVIKELEDELNLKLIILGDGPLRNSIEKEIVNLNLENKVELVGYSNNVKDYLKNADAFISCSTEEGFGVSVVEAMSYSLPVFTFSLPIFEELSGENKVIQTSEIGHIKQMAENIHEICTSPLKYNLYSDKVYQRCRKSFDINNSAESYLKLYKELKAEE